ncbi:MAG: hypothetical protein ACTSY1_11845 [Alphaproteobacteria bacterium]
MPGRSAGLKRRADIPAPGYPRYFSPHTRIALTAPGRTQLLAFDAPNLQTTAYPLVMIPVYVVPVSNIFHALCLWKIRRSRAGVEFARTAQA